MTQELKFDLGRVATKRCWKRRNCCLPAFSPFLPMVFNSLPHNEILDLSILRAFADDKINVT